MYSLDLFEARFLFMVTQPTIMTAVVMTIGISPPLVVPAKPTKGHTINYIKPYYLTYVNVNYMW